MKTGEWNETFNFDEEEADLTTAYETTDNILESLSAAGRIRKFIYLFSRRKDHYQEHTRK